MEDKWYLYDSERCIKDLESSHNGISSGEASLRLEKYGYNKLKEVKKKNIFIKFLEQFKNVMIIVLIIAAILSAFVSIKEGEPITDTAIILVVVFLNAFLGVMQESKAEKAIEALKNMSLPYIKVKRDGKVCSIKVEELVVGDLVLLEAGDYVPADMRILKSHSMRVEESALTGESAAVDKVSDKIQIPENLSAISLADRINMLYSGSSVVYGRGEAIVTSVGMKTELGKIATAISEISSEETPLQKKMNEISKILSILVVIIAVIMFVVGIIQKAPILDVFMLAIALAVAAIPEGLAAVITITLAIGVQKMAKEKSIIRKLSSVEALGSTEVICSDKTGTLTQNKMTVRKIFLNNELIDVTDKMPSVNMNMFSKIFMLCNDTKVNGEELLGDPTETALVSFGIKCGINPDEYDEKFKRIEEAPFDSERKMMSTINKVEDKYMVCTKGAIESVIYSCTHMLVNDEIVKIGKNDIENILNTNLELASDAFRVLAFAYKIQDDITEVKTAKDIKEVESNLVFVGLTAMIDPPRPEVKEAVNKCFEAGMIPVMITGDNIDTATAIAKELGIYTNNYLAITGLQLDRMSDEELKEKVSSIRVYARVSPENKIRIVKAWKSLGKTVAMTGDGVNDAPALKGADIGIGMGITGTEVSKSVSSMVLADDNFATIVDAVKEGRRIYTNIQNVIVYLLASNLAEVLIIFFATLFSKSILLPIQILWINLVTDTVPAIALGFEREEKDIMKRKPRKSNESFFTPFMITRIAVPAVIKAVLVFILYSIVDPMYGHMIASGAVFILLSFMEIFFAVICRSDKKSVFNIGITTNKQMLWCIIGTLILQFVILTIPYTRKWLTVPYMSINVYYLIGILLVIAILLFEVSKITIAKVFKKE